MSTRWCVLAGRCWRANRHAFVVPLSLPPHWRVRSGESVLCLRVPFLSAARPSRLLVQENYLKSRIKVNGKTGNLGTKITVGRDGDNVVTVEAELPFSKRWVLCLSALYSVLLRPHPSPPPSLLLPSPDR